MSKNPLQTSHRQEPVSIRGERAQALVESAIIFPLLVLLLLAVIQFGIVFKHYVTVTDAARSGARTAAVSRAQVDPPKVAEDAARASAPDLDQSQLDIVVNSTFVQGSDVIVTASYPYSVSLLGVVVKSGRLSSAITERVE